MVLAARHELTADEYFAMAGALPRWTQLIDGEVVVSEPTYKHQDIVLETALRLRLWTRAAPARGVACLPCDVKVDGRNVYSPDVWWCSEPKRPDIETVYLDYMPDLAIEVLSPSTRHYDLAIKRTRYEERGLPELWIIDPVMAKRVAARVLSRSDRARSRFDQEAVLDADDVLESPQLPGFALPLKEVLG
jgi:Uma2 family endonuclease